ncbi:hypothetical protein LTR48_007249 [Friedmanniomyces endolithicus]|uniref:Uncharacterized protein n=1 Tax=Rachicladosporium monterosium TaxID=1507873 RepID=A0ABR0L824_9PEZI|nr:hypothetical protein LTR48_007249 [Friedmanniomyces endolithicus]KAK5144942.1 hypothetical protein LTR32_003226 [Rachicladosporium monterosium]
MTHPQGWIKLNRLADAKQCEAAAEDTLHAGIKSTPKCEEVMRLVLKDHGSELEKHVNLLKRPDYLSDLLPARRHGVILTFSMSLCKAATRILPQAVPLGIDVGDIR